MDENSLQYKLFYHMGDAVTGRGRVTRHLVQATGALERRASGRGS